MAKAREVDLEKKVVRCEDLYKGVKFEVGFDYLILSVGKKVSFAVRIVGIIAMYWFLVIVVVSSMVSCRIEWCIAEY